MKNIITRTPLRITFTGGGSDLPQFYKNEPGAVINASIDKYVYIAIHNSFYKNYQVVYSSRDVAESIDEIRHPAARETCRFLKIKPGLEIVSLSDVPSRGTGLGSSSAYTVGLLNALHAWTGQPAGQKELAEEAVYIEREVLKEAGGKQDQYIASYGDIKFFKFNPAESGEVHNIYLNEENSKNFQKHLLLLYTGVDRNSAEVHEAQSKKDNTVIYRKMAELAEEHYEKLKKQNWMDTGKLLAETWEIKHSLGGNSNKSIDDLIDKALDNGAEGAKLIGAGMGGFILAFASPEKHKKIEKALNLRKLEFGFSQGTTIVYTD